MQFKYKKNERVEVTEDIDLTCLADGVFIPKGTQGNVIRRQHNGRGIIVNLDQIGNHYFDDDDTDVLKVIHPQESR